MIAARAGTLISRFATALEGRKCQVDLRSADELVIESGTRHAYIHRDDGLGDEYDAPDIERILDLVPNPVFFVLEFNDFEFGKEVLEQIVDADGLAVDNDHGDILAGRDFAERMRRNRNWDWRSASL